MNVVRTSCDNDSKMFLSIRSFLYFCLCCLTLTSYLSVECSDQEQTQKAKDEINNLILEFNKKAQEYNKASDFSGRLNKLQGLCNEYKAILEKHNKHLKEKYAQQYNQKDSIGKEVDKAKQDLIQAFKAADEKLETELQKVGTGLTIDEQYDNNYKQIEQHINKLKELKELSDKLGTLGSDTDTQTAVGKELKANKATAEIAQAQGRLETAFCDAAKKLEDAAGRVTVNDLSDASAQECHKMYQEVRSELSDLKTRLDYLKNLRNDGTSIISDNAKINDTYNVLGKYKGLMDALNAVSISTTEAYSNKKSGSLEISGMAGYLFNVGKNIYLGFEVEGGAGFNLGNKFKLDSYSEQWEKDDTQHEVTNDINDATKGLVLQSKMIYGYVTPKFVAQIYRFILKVGPRLQFSGLSYGSDVIKIFNVGIQADALVEIKKYLSGGIKFVWSPVKGSKVIGGGSKKDNLTCKYGDLSILLCINGQYRNNTAGFYVGGSISGGWKMSKVNISKTDKFEDSSCGAGLQDYIDSLKTQDNSDDESLNTSEKNSSSSE